MNKFLRQIISFAFVAAFCASIYSQTTIQMTPVGDERLRENPISLTELSANVEVMGNIAVTKLDMVFK
ncbi:MAG: hypothetical protein J5700_04480, partial [Treponema sp.]|nr:hypothetical protein [Treponema sp.]